MIPLRACALHVSQIKAMDSESGIQLPLGRCLHLTLLSLLLSGHSVFRVQASALPKGDICSGANG